MTYCTTPSQTVGPYFAIGMPWPDGPYAIPKDAPGAITLSGYVYDGAGRVVRDNMIEVWGADGEGHFADLWGVGGGSSVTDFRGFARCAEEDGDGRFEIVTLKPAAITLPDGVVLAPHLDANVFARGMLKHVVTRIYFGDEAAANAGDPILAQVPPDRRDTLIARATDDGYELDIRLQGPGETVFFAL